MELSKRHMGGFNALSHDAFTRYDRMRSRMSGPGAGQQADVLFLHIPKCAGVSIRHALGLPNPGHKLLCDFSKEELARVGRIVVCTRDPFDRLVSAFKFHKRISTSKPRLLRAMVGHPRLGEFSDFIRSSAPERLEAYHYFYRSQFQYLKGIEDYREKLIHLRFETLAADFEQHFGLGLPQMNSGGGSAHDAEFDTPENRARVKSIYRADYELLPKLLKE